MKSVPAFLRLLRSAPPGWTAGLLVLMVFSSLTEGFGLLLAVPMLGLLDGNDSSNSEAVRYLMEWFRATGLPVSVGGLLVAFFVLVVLRSVIQYAREHLGASLQHRVVDDMRQRCFAALLGVEWRWIVAGRKSNHANLLLTDVSRVGTGLNFGLSLLASLASGAAYLSAAFVLSWPMTALALASGGLVFWLLSGHRRAALRLGQRLGTANRELQGNVQEGLAGIKLTKILNSEGRHLDHFMQTTRQLRDEQLRFMSSTSLSRALFQVGGALLLTIYLYAGLSIWKTPLPELLVLAMIFARLIPLLMSAHQHYHHWLHAMPALGEIDSLLAECKRAAEPGSEPGSMPIPVKEAICLNGVGVRYEGRAQAALDDVSLCFPARTTTALMGASGAGKSTLADVLIGLLEPDSGQLTVDGVPITGSHRMTWRRSVAYVPQEVFLFHDSIRTNLLLAAPEASDEDLQLALKRAAADFVFKLPQGLDTMVGDAGVRLSGGERQRIALARALLKQPSLLILDEATSALDVENEARVRRAIENLHGDMTVVIIGHRLPTLEHADKVVVLEAGRVAAQGSWRDISPHLERVA